VWIVKVTPRKAPASVEGTEHSRPVAEHESDAAKPPVRDHRNGAEKLIRVVDDGPSSRTATRRSLD
jgi:hypothetical protein